jgi:membrane-associated phospholipid phosphatase
VRESAARSTLCGLSTLLALLLASHAHAEPKLEWKRHWPKMSAAEYVLTGTAIAGTLTIVLALDPPSDGYTRGVLYDGAVRDWIGASNREQRDVARTIGDFGYRSLLIYPFADAAITALAVHGNGEVAWQMFSISAQAMSLAGLAGITTDHLIGRARPSYAPCKSDPEYERFCNEEDEFSSFISGHTAVASAGAAVTCAHHLNLPLYGGGAADVLACAGTSALAIATGVSRLVNDRHWATDVTFAWGVGAITGYVLPSLLHYRDRPAPASSLATPRLRHTIVPMLAPRAFGLSLYAMY